MEPGFEKNSRNRRVRNGLILSAAVAAAAVAGGIWKYSSIGKKTDAIHDDVARILNPDMPLPAQPFGFSPKHQTAHATGAVPDAGADGGPGIDEYPEVSPINLAKLALQHARGSEQGKLFNALELLSLLQGLQKDADGLQREARYKGDVKISRKVLAKVGMDEVELQKFQRIAQIRNESKELSKESDEEEGNHLQKADASFKAIITALIGDRSEVPDQEFLGILEELTAGERKSVSDFVKEIVAYARRNLLRNPGSGITEFDLAYLERVYIKKSTANQ